MGKCGDEISNSANTVHAYDIRRIAADILFELDIIEREIVGLTEGTNLGVELLKSVRREPCVRHRVKVNEPVANDHFRMTDPKWRTPPHSRISRSRTPPTSCSLLPASPYYDGASRSRCHQPMRRISGGKAR